MDMTIRCRAQWLVEGAGGHDRLAAAASQMRHRAAASAAECRGEAARLRQVEPQHGGLALQPAQRGGLDDHLAGMRRSARLAAARAVTVQEFVERPVHLEGYLTAQAAAPERPHLPSPDPIQAVTYKRSAET